MLAEVTAFFGNNKIKKEEDGRYHTATVWILLSLFDASDLLMLLFAISVQ